MKYWLLVAILLAISASPLLAQHVELGGFGSYEHYGQTGLPNQEFGLGARIGFNLVKFVQLELETSYDFKHAKFNATNTGTSIIVNNTKLGVLHANAGLKVQSPGGSFFLFLKGGANRFDAEREVTTAFGFPTVSTITQGTERSYVKGVFYPGGGIGFHAGPLGIRFDVGDEIYWDNGAHNNLRITFGPTFRF